MFVSLTSQISVISNFAIVCLFTDGQFRVKGLGYCYNCLFIQCDLLFSE